MDERQKRDQVIIRTSIIGILANVLLAAFKALVGLAAGSIAIVLDAVNNLSDALSSLITIIGTKIASRAPDKKHPLGHGRVEYISATIIAVIILYAGVTSLSEAVRKIISPTKPSYSPEGLMIIAVAVAVKILLGTFVKKTGQRVSSDALTESGTDALMDAVISLSTLAAALVFIFGHLSLEAWLGAVISAVIIKSGIDMMRETLSKITGERVDSDLAHDIKHIVRSFPEVKGAYDLIVHNYGPSRLIGSMHIEVPDTMTVDELDTLEREITDKVYDETGVLLAGISVYAMNTKSSRSRQIQTKLRRIIMSHDGVLQTHGFYLDEKEHLIKLDVIIDYALKDRQQVYDHICREAQEAFPGYKLDILFDIDGSD